MFGWVLLHIGWKRKTKAGVSVFLRILVDQETYCEIPGDIEVIGMKG